MLQFEHWKRILVIGIACLAVLLASPNFVSNSDFKLDFLPSKHINLGLDLQGGSHLLLRVDTETVKIERLNNVSEMVRRDLRKEKIRFSGLLVSNGNDLTIRDISDVDSAHEVLKVWVQITNSKY